jgi:hypothetical protein
MDERGIALTAVPENRGRAAFFLNFSSIRLRASSLDRLDTVDAYERLFTASILHTHAVAEWEGPDTD